MSFIAKCQNFAVPKGRRTEAQRMVHPIKPPPPRPPDPAPRAGTPTVGTPDPTFGTVSGSLGFAKDPSDDLTYTVDTGPTEGRVILDGVGGYTYEPTQAARLAATATTSDRFTASVH